MVIKMRKIGVILAAVIFVMTSLLKVFGYNENLDVIVTFDAPKEVQIGEDVNIAAQITDIASNLTDQEINLIAASYVNNQIINVIIESGNINDSQLLIKANVKVMSPLQVIKVFIWTPDELRPLSEFAIFPKALNSRSEILVGTPFGTAPFNESSKFENVFDGNVDTIFDSESATEGYVGLDLGSGNEKKLTQIDFYPRIGVGYENRMLNGKFQGSNTSIDSGYVDLYTITTTPKQGWNSIVINSDTAYRYLRYVGPTDAYCNVAEIKFRTSEMGSTANNYVELSGTQFGSDNTYTKVFDNDNDTFFDVLNGYVGIDLGPNIYKRIAKISFVPRSGEEYSSRMLGGKFQGSNTSPTSGFVDLHTISSQPHSGENEVYIYNMTKFRYIRYVGPENGYCNIAEMKIFTRGVESMPSFVTMGGAYKVQDLGLQNAEGWQAANDLQVGLHVHPVGWRDNWWEWIHSTNEYIYHEEPGRFQRTVDSVCTNFKDTNKYFTFETDIADFRGTADPEKVFGEVDLIENSGMDCFATTCNISTEEMLYNTAVADEFREKVTIPFNEKGIDAYLLFSPVSPSAANPPAGYTPDTTHYTSTNVYSTYLSDSREVMQILLDSGKWLDVFRRSCAQGICLDYPASYFFGETKWRDWLIQIIQQAHQEGIPVSIIINSSGYDQTIEQVQMMYDILKSNNALPDGWICNNFSASEFSPIPETNPDGTYTDTLSGAALYLIRQMNNY